MPSLAAIDPFAHLRRQAHELDVAIDTVFPDTDKQSQARALARRYFGQADQLVANRGLSVPTIGFMGEKKAGKSYLLTQYMLTNDAIRTQVPVGFGDKGRTEQLIWIGSDLPPELDPSYERGIHCDISRDTRLRQPATLVDIPGFNDEHEGARRAAEDRALQSCHVKVLVMMHGTEAADRTAEYAERAAGPIILPVLNMCCGTYEEVKAAGDNYYRRIKDAAPLAKVLPVVFIGDSRLAQELRFDTLDEAIQKLTDAIHAAIRALSESNETAHLVALSVLKRWKQETAHLFEAELHELLPLLEHIDEVIGKLPEELVKSYVGNNRLTEAGVRLGLRAELMHVVSPLFFPLRTLLGVLALTSNTWDKLTLAVAGSVPSLAMTIFQSAKNVRSLFAGQSTADEDYQAAFHSRAAELLHGDLLALRAKLNIFTDNKELEAVTIPKPRFHGLDALKQKARGVYEAQVSAHVPGRFWLLLVGWFSVFIFWGLMVGPMMALYRQYGDLVTAVLFGDTHTTWRDFPAPNLTTIIAWFWISLFPVFMIALLTAAFGTSRRRVRECNDAIARHVQMEIRKLTDMRILRVEVADAKVQAIRTLCQVIRSEVLDVTLGRFIAPAKLPQTQ